MKKPYQAPKLVNLGGVADLTQVAVNCVRNGSLCPS